MFKIVFVTINTHLLLNAQLQINQKIACQWQIPLGQ